MNAALCPLPPRQVKAYARKNPHPLGAWAPGCKSRVAHMSGGDYFGSERSHTCAAATAVTIEHTAADGAVKVLKASLKLQAGEIVDAAVMSVGALRAFYEQEFTAAKDNGTLASLHLKATMMKISDPVCARSLTPIIIAKPCGPISPSLFVIHSLTRFLPPFAPLALTSRRSSLATP